MQRFKDNLKRLDDHDHVRGHIRIMREDTGEILFEEKNVIVNTVKWLFARLMAESSGALSGATGNPSYPNIPQFGIWGLALGAGDNSWPPETQPVETPEQTALISEFKRKQCSKIRYVDSELNPITGLSLQVDFQTIVNATTDNILQPIREMGLIGGGTSTTTALPAPFTVTPVTDLSNPLTPYFDPNSPSLDSVILINYKTLPPLPLPPGINLIFSWVLSF
jgi:hypothetical protein